ncbi:MAG: PH domain-containing protein [Candidatus Andersenbacteria bacterium]
MQQPGKAFEGQHPNERIIIFTRQHWIVLVSAILSIVLIEAVFIGAVVVVLYALHLPFAGQTRLIVTVLASVLLLMGWLLLFVRFVTYYLDVWILTDERIVQVKQRSLFNREIDEFELSTVQDVSSQVRGVLGTFLGYGTIFVQTAAARDLFDFNFIPRPSKVEETILNQRSAVQERIKHEIGAAAGSGGPVSTADIEDMRHDLSGLQ